MKISKEEYLSVKRKQSEDEFGDLAPDEIDCIYFNICCEIGTIQTCRKCKRKILTPAG